LELSVIKVIGDSGNLESYYDTIYLSPHLDDVALSCGGQIYQQTAAGESVLVVTIMAGDPAVDQLSPFADSLHRRWSLSNLAGVVQARRKEDAVACQILGAAFQHWSIPDCIYRADPDTDQLLYEDVAAIFGPIRETEHSLVQSVSEAFRQLPEHGYLVPPLTLGHHVDHQIVRRAAAMGYGPDLWHYEDYPYAQWPDGGQQLALYQRTWQSRVVPLGNDALEARSRAIAAFRSQVSSFFRDEADLRKQVSAYAGQVGGERLWRRKKD
jgi:LmbE family N-acetylglucosaminyl deacetylase